MIFEFEHFTQLHTRIVYAKLFDSMRIMPSLGILAACMKQKAYTLMGLKLPWNKIQQIIVIFPHLCECVCAIYQNKFLIISQNAAGAVATAEARAAVSRRMETFDLHRSSGNSFHKKMWNSNSQLNFLMLNISLLIYNLIDFNDLNRRPSSKVWRLQ